MAKDWGSVDVPHQQVIFHVDGRALPISALMVIPIAAVMQIFSVLSLMTFRSPQHWSTGAGFKHARVLPSGSASSAFFLQIFLLNFIWTYQQLLFAHCKSLWHAGLNTYEKPIETWLSNRRPVVSRPLSSPGYKGFFLLLFDCRMHSMWCTGKLHVTELHRRRMLTADHTEATSCWKIRCWRCR